MPLWQNHPAWSASLKVSSEIIIEGDEPWFIEHSQLKKNSTKPTSIGYFLIGIQSYESVEFAISVKTVQNSLKKTNSTRIEVETLYQGL